MSWFRKWLQRPYDKAIEELEIRLGVSPRDISEPVLSIVKSFSEKGRWKIKEEFNLLSHNSHKSYSKFKAQDTLTGEFYSFQSRWFIYYVTQSKTIIMPSQVVNYTLPTWMTDSEKEFVVSSIQGYVDKINERFIRIRDRENSASDARCKINQEKERNRLKAIYCK